MEKYTSEVLAEMSHEELENEVLAIQQKLMEERNNSKMYREWWSNVTKEKEGVQNRLNALHNLMHTWE